VRCAECAAEVPPLREFCPKCGAPTDPGLRERRHQLGKPRTAGELKSNRKKVLIAVAAVLSIGVVGNAIFDPDWDNDDREGIVLPEREEARGAVTISAQQLYEAYRDDERSADRRFDDREMVVSGEFLRIVPDGYGSLDLRLKTSNPEQPVGVDLADLAIEDGKKLRPGQQVTVSCQGMGDGDDIVWVRECAVQSATDSNAGPAAPPAPTAPSAPQAPAAPGSAEGNQG
jgi:hypothetical protein